MSKIIKVELGFSCEDESAVKQLLTYLDKNMGKDIDSMGGVKLIPEHVRIGSAKEVFSSDTRK